jgi:N-acyl-D-amino-acid deacylase
MSEYEVIIHGGTIVDGTGAPRYKGDVGIRDGKVATIGRLDPADADRALDATGLIVAPGFIDLHTHYDAQVFWDPYCSLSGWHGVTSLVIGNCGFGFAPVAPEFRERSMLSMTRVEAIPLESMRAGLPWDWVTFPEFMDSLERTPKSVNLLPYVPVNPLMIWVMGFEEAKSGRMPTDAEHKEMRRLLHEAMDAGACGWSAQRLFPDGPGSIQRDYDGTPMVSDVMHTETCIELAEVLAERNEGFIQMTLVSGDPKADAVVYELLAEVSGRPVLFNVVQTYDDRPNVHRGTLKWLERCQRQGIRVYGQGQTTDSGITFTFEDWNLYDESTPWREATTGTLEEKLEKLADPARREALRNNLPRTVTAPLEQTVVLGPRTDATKPFENFTVAEVGEKLGKHPVDAMLDIAVADGLRTLFYAHAPNENMDYFAEVVNHPTVPVIFGVSDGGAHTKFLTAGRYPTESIIRATRDNEILSLEQMHWRLSAYPAWCAGFQDRGTIRRGDPADIVVYDLENLDMTPVETVYDFPANEWRRVQRAIGYRWILVNGQITIEDDKETGVSSGVLLRHGVGADLA